MTQPTSRPHSLPRAAALLAAVAVLALLPSCSTYGPPQPSMPAARATLRPEYRVFYDELVEYGDWILIEPFGFVFRPKTRFANWSPYYDGFWSPSDSYGWIWVSGEPFGWATYHYGSWLDDSYQGWVWVPGLEWAPAWVAWTGNQGYVGWSALSPRGGAAGSFNVVPRGDLAATNLRAVVLPKDKAATALQNAEPIENTGVVDRVTVNRGPRIEWIEQASGPLPRARLEDIGDRRGSHWATPTSGTKPEPSATPATPPATSEFKRATESAATEARQVMQKKQPAPETIARIRVTDAPARMTPPPKRTGQSAPSDSSR